MSNEREHPNLSEQDIEQLRKKVRDEIINLATSGESIVDVYGPVTYSLEEVMEEYRIQEEKKQTILRIVADIDVRIKTIKNPILKLMLKRERKRLIDTTTHFDTMPEIHRVVEDTVPVNTPWGTTLAPRRGLFMTAGEWYEEGVGGAVHHRTNTGAREKEAREDARRRREEEQREQEEVEKEHQFRRRQIDRYLGDLKAIDMEDSTVEEIEQFLEDLEPRDEEEEILASNLHKLLEKVKHDRGL